MKNLIFILVASVIPQFASAQFGGVLKNLKDAADKAKEQASQQLQIPAKQNATSPQDVTSQLKNKADDASTAQTVVKSQGIIDIKGLTIDLNIDAAQKIINSASVNKCTRAKINLNNEAFLYGDEIISCRGDFQYFGSRIDTMNSFYEADKLKYIVMGAFYSESSGSDEQPAVFKAISEKYGVKPPVIKQKTAVRDVFNFETYFEDSVGNTISAAGVLEKDLSGSEQKKVYLSLMAPNFDEYKNSRIKMINDLSSKAEKAAENKRKSDL
jgi:hypothetical protein